VSCSTFVLIHFSQTKPTPFFSIQKIFETNSATSIIPDISGIILGIFGAGGNIGREKSIFGIKDGNSGSVGGGGNKGICGSS
jgi:hypothetical protein